MSESNWTHKTFDFWLCKCFQIMENAQWKSVFNVKHIIIDFIMLEIIQQDCITYFFLLLHTESINTKCIVESIKPMKMRIHLHMLTETLWGHMQMLWNFWKKTADAPFFHFFKTIILMRMRWELPIYI